MFSVCKFNIPYKLRNVELKSTGNVQNDICTLSIYKIPEFPIFNALTPYMSICIFANIVYWGQVPLAWVNTVQHLFSAIYNESTIDSCLSSEQPNLCSA